MPSILEGKIPNWKNYFMTHFTGSNDSITAKDHQNDCECYDKQYGATELSDAVQLLRFCLAGKARTWLLDRYTVSNQGSTKEGFLKAVW